jgi:hypothetical protein
LVKTYVKDLDKLLEASGPAEGKDFMRSIVRWIELEEGAATIHYRLPTSPASQTADRFSLR